jgi:hypothetical protein
MRAYSFLAATVLLAACADRQDPTAPIERVTAFPPGPSQPMSGGVQRSPTSNASDPRTWGIKVPQAPARSGGVIIDYASPAGQHPDQRVHNDGIKVPDAPIQNGGGADDSSTNRNQPDQRVHNDGIKVPQAPVRNDGVIIDYVRTAGEQPEQRVHNEGIRVPDAPVRGARAAQRAKQGIIGPDI